MYPQHSKNAIEYGPNDDIFLIVLGVLLALTFLCLYLVHSEFARRDKPKPQEPTQTAVKQDDNNNNNNNQPPSSALTIPNPANPTSPIPDPEVQEFLENRLAAQMEKTIASLRDLDALPFAVFWDEDSDAFEDRHRNDLQTLAVLRKIDTKFRALEVETQVKEAVAQQGKE
ncbi:MAG: hypothetical protein LQ346_008557 [Caloplaca aetnensis]|nr:MAG: hypothetical protein LQ346_008557 [Caloplaca aetnensis]